MDRFSHQVTKPAFSLLSTLIALTVYGLTSTPALGYSHGFIQQERSSTESHIFVSQEAEGEYGTYAATADNYPASEVWKGYGFRNSLGLELMKFIEISAGHEFLNMRNQGASVEKLTGSRMDAEIKLNFYAPIGDLQVGTGVTASRLDYQAGVDSASFYGSGIYYLLGMNHFLSERVSMFGEAKIIQENLVKTSGDAPTDNLRTKTTAVGCGFNLWL